MKLSSDLVIYDLEGSCKTFEKKEINETNITEIGAVKLDKKTFEIFVLHRQVAKGYQS